MIYKMIFILIILICLGWYFKDTLMDYGRSWYFEVPLPKYHVIVDHEVPIPMSDGVNLIGDIYRPKNRGKFPAILTRTPYGRQNTDHYYEQIAKLFAGQGFIFIVQDVRGKRPSEGDFYPHQNDAQDGAETISWIVNQPWSDSQIALFGFSYLGVTSWQAVNHSKYKVSTLIPWFTGSSPYQLWYDKGVPYLKQFIFWMSKYEGTSSKNILHQDVDHALTKTIDWKELDMIVIGKTIPAYRDFLTHSKFDDFWKQFSTPLPEMTQDIPVLLGSGWYDQFLKSTIEDFKVLNQAPEGSKKKESRLILGPWTHHPVQKIHALNLRHDANFLKQFSVMLKWYQKWMGSDQSLELAPVTYYLMGANQWRTAINWPPPEATPVKYYLNSSDKNTLPYKLPTAGKSSLLFETRNFVPSIGGRMLYSNGKEGPKDQFFLEERDDVLIWTSSPLQQELPLVGAPRILLYLSDAPLSFDLSIKLIDVFPGGKMQLITDGYVRIERNESYSPFAVEVNLTDTAYVIPTNHHLQIAITHSDFPAHAPNNQLMDMPKASISILTGFEYPSSIEVLKLPL